MDIRRISVNGEYKYVDKDRKRIKDKKTLKRIKSLRIPPAYNKIKISKKANSKVQAIGIDSLGRSQYIYNPKFIQEQQQIKFEDLINFGKKIKRIRKDYRNHIESSKPIYDKNKVISMVLFLLDVCKFRVGTEEYKKKYHTYGATTIGTEHILFNNDNVEISFIGKKSVKNTSTIKNQEVIKMLEKLCMTNKGKEYLFYYADERTGNIYNINAGHINSYLKKYHKDLMPKMFRTWNGNSILLKYLISKGIPLNEREIKKNLREGIKRVAEGLHNTMAVSKKSYCNSEIYTTYLNDNDKFWEFIESNKRDNGDNKSTDRILTLFLIKYYKNDLK